MLTREELLALLARLDAKKKEREMNKMAETLQRALEKKQGKTHVDTDTTATKDNSKAKKVKTTPAAGKKPATRSAGRGR